MPPEWKKLKNGPPPYFELLEKIFDGVAVDGSTAYYPGQQDSEGEEEEYEYDNAAYNLTAGDSPATSGSRKRPSSNTSTATSPSKKSKSPMVKIFRDLLDLNRQANHDNKALIDAQLDKQTKKLGQVEQLNKLAVEAGVRRGTREHLALGILLQNDVMAQMFQSCETATERLDFIRTYMDMHNL